MRILLEHHGVNLSGVKSNLYTDLSKGIHFSFTLKIDWGLGLDSKHPSHLQSTVSIFMTRSFSRSEHGKLQIWKPTDLMKDTEIKVSGLVLFNSPAG